MQNPISSQLFLDLLHPQIDISQKFFQFLNTSDIIILMLLNSNAKNLIKNNSSVTNRLFYHNRLQIQKSIYFDFQIQGIKSRKHLHQTIQKISTNSLNFSLEIIALGLLQNQLIKNLKKYIQDQQALKSLSNLRSFMMQPQLPIPELQKQGIGEHCNTTIQIFITKESIQNSIQPFEQQYSSLRRQVLNNIDQIMSFFEKINNHGLLKTIRYNPQLIYQYIPTDSHFVNIIQLLLVIITVYVNSIRKLLEQFSISQKTIEIFKQFSLRYCIFRNTIFSLEETYGFLFKHFNEAFQNQFPFYPSLPSFSLWRVALKIWSRNMSVFHDSNSQILSELMLVEIQTVTKCIVDQYIISPESTNNSSVQCEYRRSNDIPCQNVFHIPTQQRESLFSIYQQYLIDISANQFNIHWCGSTEQRLDGPYFQSEQKLILTTSKYCSYLSNTFSFPIIIRKIIQQIKDILQQCLKPTTFIKIQNRLNQFLESVKKEILLSDDLSLKEVVSVWKIKKANTTKRDAWIRYSAEKKGLKQQSGEKYKMYFDTNCFIDLVQLQKQIRIFKQQIQYSKQMITKAHTKISIQCKSQQQHPKQIQRK